MRMSARTKSSEGTACAKKPKVITVIGESDSDEEAVDARDEHEDVEENLRSNEMLSIGSKGCWEAYDCV